MDKFLSADLIRTRFSQAMSAMYQQEVPHYGTLMQLVATVNERSLEADIALPGWSQPLIDELTEIYAEDLAEIAALSGVEFISA